MPGLFTDQKTKTFFCSAEKIGKLKNPEISARRPGTNSKFKIFAFAQNPARRQRMRVESANAKILDPEF